MRLPVVSTAILAVLLSMTTVAARTWYILPDGSGDQPTIQSGLNAAATGDTVLVASGTYHESLFWPFRNGIILLGSGMDSTIVVGDQVQTVLYVAGTASLGEGSRVDGAPVLRYFAERTVDLTLAVPIDSTTVVRGLRFRSGGDAGIVLYGASPILDSCSVDSTRNGGGIRCFNGSAARIRRCSIVNNSGSGIQITSCNSLTLVENNTISGNSASSGGGISCSSSSPTISNNRIINNSAVYDGGGILCSSSSPIIASNTISWNTTSYGTSRGGGISCLSSSASIFGNAIEGNSAAAGGGIYCYSAHPLIIGNTITGNTRGGGIYSKSSEPAISDNHISANIHSGIVCVDFSWPTISNNMIVGNHSGEYGDGGGIASYDASVRVEGNVILGNWAWTCGGISCSAYDYQPEIVISDNLILANRSGTDGLAGGIGLWTQSGWSWLEICGNTIAENWAGRNEYVPAGGGGMYMGGGGEWSNVTISHNSIVRNAALGDGGGLYLENVVGLGVFRNTMSENMAEGLGDGIYTTGSVPTISFCNIAYNSWGIHNTSYASIPVARNNWWGHSSGPWHSGGNPTGRGDSLSIYAWDFIPWLDEADTTAPPIPPRNLGAAPQPDGTLLLSWDGVPIGDLAGYRVHFDTDTLGWPYADSVDAGGDTTYVLSGLQNGTTYYVAVTCYDNDGNRSWYSAPDSAVAEVSTGVETASVPTAYRLGPNVPNPFNPTTTISFSVPVAGPVSLTVHDITGRRVATVADGVHQPGEFTAVWNGRDDTGREVASGIYFARMVAGGFEATEKMVLLR